MAKFSQEDILSYAPVCKDKVETGMTIGEICEAAIRQSDNTAGNLQFKLIGGVDEFEKALREIGDNVTNADRIETELNNVALDDIRDTSTPKQLVENLKAYLSGDILSSDKKSILKDWLSNNQTGDALIRAGAPKDSKVYDKSGAGDYGIRNDIAMVELPNGDKVFVAILSKKQNKDDKYDNKLIEEASRIIFENI